MRNSKPRWRREQRGKEDTLTVKTRPYVPLRYSPQRIHAYNVGNRGPGHSAFLRNDPEVWNLAFLSHPYELAPEHGDPAFTTLVRQTVNTVLASGELDHKFRFQPKALVRGLLQTPARRFLGDLAVAACPSGRLLYRLPLYEAFGDEWLEMMHARASLCLPERVADESLPGDAVPHVRDAAAALARIARL